MPEQLTSMQSMRQVSPSCHSLNVSSGFPLTIACDVVSITGELRVSRPHRPECAKDLLSWEAVGESKRIPVQPAIGMMKTAKAARPCCLHLLRKPCVANMIARFREVNLPAV